MTVPKTFVIAGAFADWTPDGLLKTAIGADRLGVERIVLPDGIAPAKGGAGWPDALILISWLARLTTRISLFGAVSSLGHQPYNLARRLASLDLISRGRAGWAIINDDTDQDAFEAFSGEARFTGVDLAERQAEFETVVQGLWESWDADALVLDKAAGEFFDPEAMHTLDHQGRHFSVRGPLNVMRWNGGAPTLIRAGDLGDAAIATNPDEAERLLEGRE